VVAVNVAILSVVLIGFVALGVDVGLMFNARQELQRATDAAAMAGAAMLAQSGAANDPEGLARQAAADCAAQNKVAGDFLTIDPMADVEFGQAERRVEDGPFVFTSGVSPPNAVRVRGRRMAGAPDGPIPLYFAAIFGQTTTEWRCTATAMMRPRDMAVVADMSNSHNNDSELRNLQDTYINLHEVWANLYPRGEWPGWADDDPQAAGWAWGYFKIPGAGFGYDTRRPPSVLMEPGDYDPKSDRGLVALPSSRSPRSPTHWAPSSDPQYQELERYLARQRGYQGDFATRGSEIQNILGDFSTARSLEKRFEHWKNRAAVATGYADWNSGIPGGRGDQQGLSPPPAGAGYDPATQYGDQTLDDAEMIWSYEGDGEVRAKLTEESTPKSMADLWAEYAEYVQRPESTMVSRREGGNPDFRYRFGVKTFTNFLMDMRPTNAETPEFANAPAQPMQAVKEAVQVLVDMLSVDRHDYLSLEIYGTTARHEVDLGPELQAVAGRLNAMQAGYYDGFTNIAGGLRVGGESLTGPNARPGSSRITILLSDGLPTAFETVDIDGNPTISVGSGSANVESAKERALQEAQSARDAGITIYAVSVGADADQEFLELLANITYGKHFHAEGSIEEYSQGLRAIFATIADIRPVALIE